MRQPYSNDINDYTSEGFAAKIKNLADAEVKIAKRLELHKFAVIPADY